MRMRAAEIGIVERRCCGGGNGKDEVEDLPGRWEGSATEREKRRDGINNT